MLYCTVTKVGLRTKTKTTSVIDLPESCILIAALSPRWCDPSGEVSEVSCWITVNFREVHSQQPRSSSVVDFVVVVDQILKYLTLQHYYLLPEAQSQNLKSNNLVYADATSPRD